MEGRPVPTGDTGVLPPSACSLDAMNVQRSTLEAMGGLARAKAQALDQLTIDRRLQVERIGGLLAPHVLAVTALDADH